MSLRWTKLYNSEWIEGSIRIDLTPAERSIWADFLALAGLSRREGYIERSQGIPYTIKELAHKLALTGTEDETINEGMELLKSTISKCEREGRIELDECGTIRIVNWDKYQSTPEKVREKKKRTLQAREDKATLQQTIVDLNDSTNRLATKVQYVPNPSDPNTVVNISTGEIKKVVSLG